MMRIRVFATLAVFGLVLSGCTAVEPEPAIESAPEEAVVEQPAEPEEPERIAPDWAQPETPSDVELCKVLDGQSQAARESFEGYAVNGKRARGNIGFPLSPHTLPVSGESNMIAVMVAFDDAPPSNQTPEGYLRPQLDTMEEWADYWSQGKLDLNFQLVDEWITLPVNHQDYPVNRDLSFEERQGNSNAIIQMIAQSLPADLNYDEVDGVMAYWSPGIDYFEGDLGLQGLEGVPLPFPGGAKEVFFWSGNEWWYRDEGQLTAEIRAQHTWSFWLYLMLDAMGLHNHGPGNGWPMAVQTSQIPAQGEFSGSLNGWDEFKLGWTDDSQVHCMAPEDLTEPSQFMLGAREVYGGDKRLAIVPFEGEGALVIESRRPIGWSETWKDDRSGLLVYFVDTELDVDRVDSFTQGGCGTSDEQQKWAYFLYKDGFSGDCRNWYEAFIKPGDTVTHKGVSIALEFSDDELDYVTVSARADTQ
jgi:hypothetical protein